MPYILPEVIHPETVKFCIEVPNERFYLEAFWGALWTLSRPYNHDDDDEHTALEVASVWRELWFANHDGFIEGKLMCGCCPQDIEIQLRILQQNNAYFNFVMNIMDDGETPDSFMPDAPEGFDTNTGDEDPAARVRALCAAVTRYVYNILRAMVEAYAIPDEVGDILELLPPFGIVLGITDAIVDIAQGAINGLIGDSEAIEDVICHMIQNLEGQANNHDIFKDSVDPSSFDVGTNAWQIAVIVDIANASVSNWRAFNSILPETYGQALSGAPLDCPCDCDDGVILFDFAGTGCEITPVGDCIYRFYQPVGEDVGGGLVINRFSFRDTLGRCLMIENTGDPARPTNAVGYFTEIHNCADEYSNFPGGFDGGTLKDAKWWIAEPVETTYYKITLAP